jgi:hypothetical protein
VAAAAVEPTAEHLVITKVGMVEDILLMIQQPEVLPELIQEQAVVVEDSLQTVRADPVVLESLLCNL